jgi:hypothetical protein
VKAAVAVTALILLGGCPYCPVEYVYPDYAHGERWEAADALFHQDPRWLGGDAAYSIDLGNDRSLWLFGDSFIATSPNLTRRESTMVRNSIAVMTGRDPLTATMDFAWRETTTPSSFFPELGDHWLWPVDGVRLPNGPLLLFLSEQRPTPGVGLGFAGAGFRAIRVVNPDSPPEQWTIEPVASLPAPADVNAAVGNCIAIDGEYLYAVSVDGDSKHNGRLARWPTFVVGEGDLTEPEWLADSTWVAQAGLDRNPDIVFEDAGSECSLRGSNESYIGWTYVASKGFGSSTIAVRTAPSIEKGWKLISPNAFAPEGDFTYAAKAHPQLLPNGDKSDYRWDFVATYADNSFTFADLFDPEKEKTLYWPHFVRIQFGYPAC